MRSHTRGGVFLNLVRARRDAQGFVFEKNPRYRRHVRNKRVPKYSGILTINQVEFRTEKNKVFECC